MSFPSSLRAELWLTKNYNKGVACVFSCITGYWVTRKNVKSRRKIFQVSRINFSALEGKRVESDSGLWSNHGKNDGRERSRSSRHLCMCLPGSQELEATQASADGWWVSTMWSVHTADCHSALTRQETLIHPTAWTSLDDITQEASNKRTSAVYAPSQSVSSR